MVTTGTRSARHTPGGHRETYGETSHDIQVYVHLRYLYGLHDSTGGLVIIESLAHRVSPELSTHLHPIAPIYALNPPLDPMSVRGRAGSLHILRRITDT